MSKQIDDGGPAFPNNDSQGCAFDPGMTLRDWFAGQTLNGMVGLADDLHDMDATEDWTQARIVASQAYAIADAMLAARKEVK